MVWQRKENFFDIKSSAIDKISPIGTIQINELALLSIQTLGKGRCAGVAADWLDPKCIATLNDDHTLEWLHANQNSLVFRSNHGRVPLSIRSDDTLFLIHFPCVRW